MEAQLSEKNTDLLIKETLVENSEEKYILNGQYNKVKEKAKNMETMLQQEMDESDRMHALGVRERKELNDKIKLLESDLHLSQDNHNNNELIERNLVVEAVIGDALNEVDSKIEENQKLSVEITKLIQHSKSLEVRNIELEHKINQTN